MADWRAAKELGYAQAMVEVAMLISQHARRGTLDAKTLVVLIEEIQQVQDAHKALVRAS